MIGIDAHCHVFVDDAVPSTPLVGGAAYEPPQVDVHDHARHLAEAGCDRGVLVQPSAYGADHRCLLAALWRRPEQLRGVACVGPDTSEETLREMHACGVRATRIQDGFPGGVPVEALVEVGERVAPWGWHLELWSDVRRHLTWLEDAVRRCPVPVVLDHQGYLPSDVGVDHPALRLVRTLLEDGHVWVALTGVERLFPGEVGPGHPGFAGAWEAHELAIAERVRALVETRPDQVLWGSDWPHVGLALPRPGSAEVRERLTRWVPDPAVRSRVLVDNAVRCYDFSHPVDEAGQHGDPVAVLRRWQESGALWRVVGRGTNGTTVALITCDGGEEVSRLTSGDPALAAFLDGRSSSDD